LARAGTTPSTTRGRTASGSNILPTQVSPKLGADRVRHVPARVCQQPDALRHVSHGAALTARQKCGGTVLHGQGQVERVCTAVRLGMHKLPPPSARQGGEQENRGDAVPVA
jgi:hypothetical protein